jgi:hypothetical protein
MLSQPGTPLKKTVISLLIRLAGIYNCTYRYKTAYVAGKYRDSRIVVALLLPVSCLSRDEEK